MRGVSLGPEGRQAMSLRLEGSAGKGIAPGASFFARVEGRLPDGAYVLKARGRTLTVRSSMPLAQGQALPLVARRTAGGIELVIKPESSLRAPMALPEAGMPEGSDSSRALWACARAGIALPTRRSSAISRLLGRIAALRDEGRGEAAEAMLERLEAFLERGLIPSAESLGGFSGGGERKGGRKRRDRDAGGGKPTFVLPSGEAPADALLGTIKPSAAEGWWIRLPFGYKGADIELDGVLRVYLSGDPPMARKVAAEFAWGEEPFVAELPVDTGDAVILRHDRTEGLPPMEALAEALGALGLRARVERPISKEVCRGAPSPLPRVDVRA